MKTAIKWSSLLLLLGFFTSVTAQKFNVYEGSLNFLKDQKTLNVIYLYEDMSVGDFDKEQDYIDKKVKEMNDDEAGKGDSWAKKWVADRNERFEPKFEELINEYLEGKIKVSNKDAAAYTLVLKTTHTEPGFNVGVWRRPAHINVEAWFVDTKDNSKVAAKAKMEKVPGQDAWGFDFDTGYRLQESYAKCGKEIGKYIMKKVL
ncbi:MAG: hypothetical protein HUU34_10890 [Saprospiraceae bacterium]|jgi:hypothetical protein|nr:hypothetical protein [Saprospiraceae bacterium]